MQRNASMAVRRDVRKVRTEILSEGLCTQNGSISLPHLRQSRAWSWFVVEKCVVHI